MKELEEDGDADAQSDTCHPFEYCQVGAKGRKLPLQIGFSHDILRTRLEYLREGFCFRDGILARGPAFSSRCENLRELKVIVLIMKSIIDPSNCKS